ncbi:MAG: hypothetical protein JJV96_00780 [Alphaproteobacteria bacterium]|nr:hypothetical protein [Alphaproteobacteria bacterium]
MTKLFYTLHIVNYKKRRIVYRNNTIVLLVLLICLSIISSMLGRSSSTLIPFDNMSLQSSIFNHSLEIENATVRGFGGDKFIYSKIDKIVQEEGKENLFMTGKINGEIDSIKNDEKTEFSSNMAVFDSNRDILTLQENVVVSSSDDIELIGDILSYDINTGGIFSESPFLIEDVDGNILYTTTFHMDPYIDELVFKGPIQLKVSSNNSNSYLSDGKDNE